VYDERNGAFAKLRSQRVLIYWPHGFGDFVHFGYVVPLLDPSNEYFITRYGDDFVHLFDGARGIAPIYSRVRRLGDGAEQGARHFGIDWKRIRNREGEAILSDALAQHARDAGITALLYTDYPEYEGRRAFPFHTKARALIRQLVEPSRLSAVDWNLPLQSALTFRAPDESRLRIEARLRAFVEPGEHLYLVAPGGHTNAAKAWPSANVQAFEQGLRAYDARGRTLIVDEPSLRERFGDLDVPFAHVMVTLLHAGHAFVGAAAGPLHAALAVNVGPVVGIWLRHHPDWYDEPNAGSIHLTGPHVYAKHLERRPATTTKPPALRARTVVFPKRIPDASDAFEALALLR
jgi:hypothetical protein